MEDNSWHLSKSVPITFVVAIVLQTVSLVWYVSQLDGAVENNVRDLVRHETRIQSLENVVQSQAITMARIDENIKAIRDTIEKMADK